jgi:hypothetical protein
METTVLTERNGAQIDLSPEVERYFDALRREQARFLDAIGQARAALGHDAGQIAHLSAVQGRLTRQFFDAQRLILQRRAETDAEVARIAFETEDHANVVLASAVAHAAAGQFAPPQPGEHHDGPELPGDLSPAALVEQSTRQAIAALGVLAVRTKADADALERVINDALAPTEPDSARMERQLQKVLDEWWSSEAQEGRALLDDARARAAMRLHLAHIEACEIVGAAAPVETEAPAAVAPTLLPASVVEMLDSAKADSLDGLFEALQRTLSPQPVAPVAVAAAPAMSQALVAVPSATLERAATADQFQHFWHQEPAAPVDERTLSLVDVLRRIVLPMCAVTSALALLLAWIG